MWPFKKKKENQSTGPTEFQILKAKYFSAKSVIDAHVEEYVKELATQETTLVEKVNKEIAASNVRCARCRCSTVIEKFIKNGNSFLKCNHCNNCGNEWESKPLYDINTQVTKFVDAQLNRVIDMLDDIVSKLWFNPYNPHDITCPYDSAAEYEAAMIMDIQDKHGEILSRLPLEVIYHLAYKYAKGRCYRIEEIFGFDNNYAFDNKNGEVYLGKFTSKMESILANDLGVNRLYK